MPPQQPRPSPNYVSIIAKLMWKICVPKYWQLLSGVRQWEWQIKGATLAWPHCTVRRLCSLFRPSFPLVRSIITRSKLFSGPLGNNRISKKNKGARWTGSTGRQEKLLETFRAQNRGQNINKAACFHPPGGRNESERNGKFLHFQNLELSGPTTRPGQYRWAADGNGLRTGAEGGLQT